MLSVPDATRRILDAVRPLVDGVAGADGIEDVDIDAAAGRVLAADAIATRALPPCDNSAMDGFAVRAADVPATLPVVGAIAAGDAPNATLAPGTAQKIMTGAPLPAGADAVVIREDVDDRGADAVFAESAQIGQNIRRAGEDVAAGARLVAAGTVLGPGEIGLLAAQGMAQVAVARRPRVAILGTGDELIDVGDTPRPGQIVNSNAYALAAQVREAGGIPIHGGIVRDDLDAMVDRFRGAVDADAVVTSGGVSVGDYDYVKDAFERAGVAVEFWKVAMKPGKPLAFGRAANGCLVFGLPGNPVSSMVVFELFVRPALRAMQGVRRPERPRAEVTLTRGYAKSVGRTHYARATLAWDDGRLVATPLVKQGSGMLSSMVGAHALVEIAAESGDAPAGSRWPALLLAWP